MPKAKSKSESKQALVGVFKDEVDKLQKENARLARHNDRLKESEKAATFAYQEALDTIRKKEAVIAQQEETIENFREARDRLRKKLLEAADAGEAGNKLADTDLVDRILGHLQELIERTSVQKAKKLDAPGDPFMRASAFMKSYAEVVDAIDDLRDDAWMEKRKP